nr:MAG TPA: hypothetical protein [Caudoviricetes sp.]
MMLQKICSKHLVLHKICSIFVEQKFYLPRAKDKAYKILHI